MALQHIRPWESDVPKLTAVRRQVFNFLLLFLPIDSG